MFRKPSMPALVLLGVAFAATFATAATSADAPAAAAASSVTRLGLYGTTRNSEAETAAYIAQCKANGVGVLLPSLSGGGTVIWKTDKADYYPSLKNLLDGGYDPLTDLIKQAHAAGMLVIPSVAIGPGGKMLDAHPEWETRDRTGQPSSETVTASMSFAYPEARKAKIELLMDLVKGYDVDGVLLDYCRYPENSKIAAAKYGYYGYDAPTIEVCQKLYGFDPRKVEIDSSEWKRFNQLRADTVTQFVKEFRDAVHAGGRKILVAGFGDTDPDLEKRMCGRDWAEWGRQGLIDVFYLATYQENAEQVGKVITQARSALGPRVTLLSAIAPFNNFVTNERQFTDLAKAQLAAGVDGVWIYRDDYLEKSKLWSAAKATSLLKPRAAAHKD